MGPSSQNFAPQSNSQMKIVTSSPPPSQLQSPQNKPFSPPLPQTMVYKPQSPPFQNTMVSN